MNLRRSLRIVVAGLLLALLGAAMLAVDGSPRVEHMTDVSPADIERALGLLRAHDPRRQLPGVMRVVVAEQRDINLLLQHAAARFPGLLSSVKLDPQEASLTGSFPLGSGPLRRWLNLEATLAPGNGPPEISRLRLGSLPLPSSLALPVAAWFLERRGIHVDRRLIGDVVRRVEFRDDQLVVFYAWREDTLQRILASVVPLPEQERLRAYWERLAQITRSEDLNLVVPLDRLLAPMFALARERSAAGGDAASENRAALLTLTFYANRRGLSAIVPAARGWQRPRGLFVTLQGRPDLPLHFLISATIAAQSGTPLADAVGVYKEVADTKDGSGFSFNDLAADRAGTRVGDMAVKAPRRLQELLAGGVDEVHLLPDVTDLPEFLSAEQFKERFGAVGSPAYQRLLADIEARLDQSPVLR